MTIAEQLAEALNADPRTIAELSAVTGVDGAILSRVARGLAAPSLGNAERIATGLGLQLTLTKAPRARRATSNKGRD